MPPCPGSAFVALDDARLGLAWPRASYMEAAEAGPAVLCLHRIGASSACFRFLFASRAARMMAHNAPGYFLSDPFIAEAQRPLPKPWRSRLPCM